MLNAYILTLLVMTLAALIVYGVDKLCALEGRGRIPEIVLIVLTALGGVLGTLLGMLFFRHKSNMTRKWYFLGTIVLSVVVQTSLLLLGFGVIAL